MHTTLRTHTHTHTQQQTNLALKGEVLALDHAVGPLGVEVVERQHAVDVDDAHAAEVAVHGQHVGAAAQEVLPLCVRACVRACVCVCVCVCARARVCFAQIDQQNQQTAAPSGWQQPTSATLQAPSSPQASSTPHAPPQ